jgi:peroxiredoxin Q/BCP
MIRFSTSLRAGDKAPDFALPDATGKIWKLADFAGKWLLLYFYPADFTAGCTAESCAFRDQYQDFKDAGAEIVGVSRDDAATHGAFAAEHRLPFILLSDTDAKARSAYAIPHILGRLGGRCSFVVDPVGMIRYVFDSRERHLDHVTKTLEFLRHAA